MLGERLAQGYCSTCHLHPKPELLSREMWIESVLPAMAPGESIHTPSSSAEISSLLGASASDLVAHVIPAPPLSPEEWAEIEAYYAREAPEQLRPADRRLEALPELPGFRVETPTTRRSPPATVSIRIDPELGQVVLGTIEPASLEVYDSELRPIQRLELQADPTSLEWTRSMDGRPFLAITSTGELLPNDRPDGTLILVPQQRTLPTYTESHLVLRGLRRPVSCRLIDFNGDGIPDPLVSQFGDRVGKVGLYLSSPSGEVEERVLIPRAGATHCEVYDYDSDGDLDIFALMSQAREGIYLLENNGEAEFAERPLISLPAVYGASSFRMEDIDGDGRRDILLTCGDNADLSTEFKPYHGVYIWTNQGEGEFSREFFFPANGAYHTETGDFDLDGDLDIAAISFFANFRDSPEESVILLRRGGQPDDLQFQALGLDRPRLGRWICMDAGDLDGDGDLDIVLGNFLLPLDGPAGTPSAIKDAWSEPRPPFVLLRNLAR